MGSWGALAGGCTRLNASHCGNQSGDLTCEQRNASTPYCDKCEAANDGCVAQPVVEPGCGFGAGSSSGESTSGESTTATTEQADSSGESGPVCGNGVIEAGEECDGTVLPDGATCTAAGYGEGQPVCAADCSAVIYSVCPDFVECGNGEVGAKEECDLTNLANKTCDDFPSLTGPGLVCTEQCTFNTSECMICAESGKACNDDEDCCEPNEGCAANLANVNKRCCVVGPLGMCGS